VVAREVFRRANRVSEQQGHADRARGAV